MTDTATEPTSEMILTWDDEYRLGIPQFDEQHQRLVRLVSFIAMAVTQNGNAALIKALVLDIKSYAEVHFADEEEFVRRVGFPERERHVAEHESFRRQLMHFISEAEKEAKIGMRVLQFMQGWVKKHVLECDRRYAEFHKERGAE